MCRVHQLVPEILALRKRIEDAFPNLCRIEERHVEHEQRIVAATWPVKPFLRSAGVGLLEVFCFHLCVSLQ
jgi:hypothetical protein